MRGQTSVPRCSHRQVQRARQRPLKLVPGICVAIPSASAKIRTLPRLPRSVHPREVDETPLDVRVDQFDAYLIADVEPLESTHHSTLDRRADNTHPGALLGGTSHDPFEPLAYSALQEQCGGGFLH